MLIRLAQHRLPAIYPLRLFCDAGGPISYGIDLYQLLQQAVSYVSLTSRGPTWPTLQAPTKFELVINVKTAKAIGLAVPPTLLARADELIE
jgi:putative ABC transport system substrate-binding protein